MKYILTILSIVLLSISCKQAPKKTQHPQDWFLNPPSVDDTVPGYKKNKLLIIEYEDCSLGRIDPDTTRLDFYVYQTGKLIDGREINSGIWKMRGYKIGDIYLDENKKRLPNNMRLFKK